MVNGWKITAIIFIIISLIELLGFVWVWNIGTTMMDNENECAYNICSNYSAYYYSDYENICSCYTGDEITHQEYIK